MSRRSSEEQFNRQAAHYNADWNQWSEASLRWLVEHADCRPEHRVLDVATGTGFTALAFAPLVAEVIGVDVSEGMLTQAREQARKADAGNVRFEIGAAEQLPFADASFDRVTCRVAPHHFVSVAKFAAEAYRVLRQGGRLLIADTTVPDGLPEVDAWQNRVESLRDGSHVRNYSPGEWREFASTAGFEVEAVEVLEEATPMLASSWLEKSGCTSEPATEVMQMLHNAPPEAKRLFAITGEGAGDLSFQWLRVVLSAGKR